MTRGFVGPVSGLILGFVAAAPAVAQNYTFSVQGAEQAIEVEVSSAVTVAFDTPFAELSMADPDVSDISSLSDKVVYVLGKKVGQTTLTVIGNAERLDLAHVTVVSYRDIVPMQGFLASSAKGVALERDGTVVRAAGCVAGPREAKAVDGVLAQLKDWGYLVLADVGEC